MRVEGVVQLWKSYNHEFEVETLLPDSNAHLLKSRDLPIATRLVAPVVFS